MQKQKIFQYHFLLLEKERALYAKWLKKQGCSLPYFQVLDYLFEAQEIQETGTVADALSIARQTMTSILDAMEKDGVLLRQRKESDRRKVYIALTEQGVKKHHTLSQGLWLREEAVYHAVTKEKLEIFNQIYEHIVSELQMQITQDLQES